MFKQTGNGFCTGVHMSFQLLGVDVCCTTGFGLKHGGCVICTGTGGFCGVRYTFFQCIKRRCQRIHHCSIPHLSTTYFLHA